MAKEGLFDQLRKPSGLLGEMAGKVMAHNNNDVNRWTIAQLAIGPQDRVLEIGFGPGVALESVLKIVTHGMVAGVDHSEAMERQARRRNSRAISEGRLELHVTDVSKIPYEDNTFDRVFAVNCFEYWDNPQEALNEIKRVLKPKGYLFVATHPRWLEEDKQAEIEVGNRMLDAVKEAQFVDAKLLKRRFEPIMALLVTGYKH